MTFSNLTSLPALYNSASGEGSKLSRRYLVLILIFCILSGGGATVMARSSKSRAMWPPRDYLVYYGSWGPQEIEKALAFNLIILHPGRDLANISPGLVKTLQKGRDGRAGSSDDIAVTAYVSIGEDEDVSRGPGQADTAQQGPVYFDPQRGIVKEGRDYPTRYLDEMSLIFEPKSPFLQPLPEKGFPIRLSGEGNYIKRTSSGLPDMKRGHDGIPDENGVWGSYYVNAGDLQWQNALLKKMETLSASYGVDGFFLDTLDTASPWGSYGWMQKDMALLVRRIREHFPDKILIANRGLFLLEKYADIVRPAIDGLMFESFLTEWDWTRRIGIESPYLASNAEIFNKYLIPNAVRSDGFHIFLLNYLDSSQPDFYQYLLDLESISGKYHCSSYISTPDLQSIKPPPLTYTLPPSPKALPALRNVSAAINHNGALSVTLTVEKSGTGLLPGKDYFFDIRLKSEEDSLELPYFLHRITVDYKSMKITSTENADKYTVYDFCLQKGKNYTVMARLIGNNAESATPQETAQISTIHSPAPSTVQDLKAEPGDGSVILTWSPGEANVEPSGYRILYGPSPSSPDAVMTVKEPIAAVKGLTEGTEYFFTVSAVSRDGTSGFAACQVSAVPVKGALPPPPEKTSVVTEGTRLVVSWERAKDRDISAYQIFCFPVTSGASLISQMRIPVKVGKEITTFTFSSLKAATRYCVFVTSLNSNNIESDPGEIHSIIMDRQ